MRDEGPPSAQCPEGVATTCPYCGVGCGVRAIADGRGGAAITGDDAHPANAGRLCVKGAHLGETLGLEDRLLYPRRGGARVGWDAAIALAAARFAEAIERHGPDSVAFYVSGQLLTEDYYVANKLMKGFIGSANIDTNSRLCMASSVAGHKRAFGADVVPGVYADFDAADLIVLVGSNLAWCHPVLHQRIAAAKAARPGLRLINIDPRRTATSELADMHLAVAPGSDVALFNGLLARLAASGRVDRRYVEAHVAGAAAAFEAAGAGDLGVISGETGLDPEILDAFYAEWSKTDRVVTIYSQGVNQWSCGTDKVNAILNCHLATGRMGRPGMGPFSVTGQPNAMGGREVGGLSNMLAAHMALEDPAHRALTRAFWAAPRMAERPGLKAVELFEALEAGRIKALWVMATNPAVSLPEADRVRAALAREDRFLVVSDIVARTETAEAADLLLPALGWGEKDGTVTNSERVISRQRAFLPPPGAARADWRIIADVGREIGRRLGEDWGGAFDYRAAAEIFREHAALSGLQNEGARAFDISAYEDVSDPDYEALAPFQWPAPKGASARPEARRFYAEGGFHHPDGRARMIAVRAKPAAQPLSRARPLILNTGRVRDQWHTMTRTGKSARLSRHIAEPYLEMHPSDAARLGVADARLVLVESDRGRLLARALISERQQEGVVFAPMHWTAVTSSLGRVDALVAPVVDPISGQPESKRTPVSVAPWPAKWFGFAVSAAEPFPTCGYWAKGRTATGWRVELADAHGFGDLEGVARDALGLGPEPDVAIAAYADPARGVHRLTGFQGGRPVAALFVSPGPVALSRDWVIDAFDRGDVAPFELLAGRAGAGRADDGRVVCVCHGVGERAIERAIAAGAGTLQAVGAACAAGTNCGSCRPEISAMLTASARTASLAAE